MIIPIVIFFICLFLIFHTYLFYPVSMWILAFVFQKKYKIDIDYLPFVSIIISAYNEKKVINQTIDNFLRQGYPNDKFEIIIGSDGSTDGTNEIIKQIAVNNSNIVFIPFENRRGKKFVINDIVPQAVGDILVFSDSNTRYENDAICELVKYYKDEKIGGVSGRLELTEEKDLTETGNKEGTYWKYESWIKDCEGKLGALIGANGGIYSIRKKFFVPMPAAIAVVDDLYLSLKVLEQNKDFVYNKKAIARETLAPSVNWESERKIRIIPRSIETIKQVKKILFHKRFIVSYGIWSHKIIRWITPLLLILLFFSNLVISINRANNFFNVALLIQIIIILLGISGYFFSRRNINIKIFQLFYYFLIINIALIKGLYMFLMKKYKPTWEPTPR